MSNDKILSTSIPAENLGPPGFQEILILSPGTDADTKETHEARLRDKSLRPFQVYCYLSKTISWTQKIDLELRENDNGSHIWFQDEVVNLIVKTPSGADYVFHKNENNEISSIDAYYMAHGYSEAFSGFLDGINPALDRIAFICNVPIYFSKVIAVDRKNSIQYAMIDIPYSKKSFTGGIDSVPGELMPVFALYREAKNNVSPFYRFMCYYKILEGFFKSLRSNVIRDIRKIDPDFKPTRLTIPENEDLRKFSPQYIGQGIQKVYDDYLTVEFRNAIAHFVIDGSTPLNLSEYKTDTKYQNILHICELCVREVIDDYVLMRNRKDEMGLPRSS
jgi:hypothetical protein